MMLDEDDADQSGQQELDAAESSDGSKAGRSLSMKRKQKRNKPTLSCIECAERKTKCDRARPACLACVKRQSACGYSEVANLIAANGSGRVGSKSRKSGKHSAAAPTAAGVVSSPPELPTPISFHRSTSESSSNSSPFLLSNVPHTRPSPYHVFGTSSQHPFANYWTTQGGIPEVVGVLPSKDQADTLVAKYFDAVDPVYPMLHKELFYADYDNFWALSDSEKCTTDASLLALHFAIYAMGAQFLQMETETARQQVSEFYVSAAHQSLRLYPFLSKTSLRSISAMVLMVYFLMNDNRATDAWAFAGILVRQAYAMGLHRDPEMIVPQASAVEKNQRRKIWQAVYFQDTFFTVLVKLPPTTTFSDVSVDTLTEDLQEPCDGAQLTTNPMSISAIAPRQMTPPIPPPPHTAATTKSDTAYIHSMWQLADLVQRTICTPRALSQPLTTSPRHKAHLLGSFRALYASFQTPFTNTSPAFFASLVSTSPRIARQSLFLKSNYWHCVMLIEVDVNEAGGVKCDVRGSLEAGRVAVGSFLNFWGGGGLRGDAGVWWVFQHRAFEEALTMANLLVAYRPGTICSPTEQPLIEPLFANARDDVRRVLDILEQVGNAAPEMQKTRTDVLRAAYEKIMW